MPKKQRSEAATLTGKPIPSLKFYMLDIEVAPNRIMLGLKLCGSKAAALSDEYLQYDGLDEIRTSPWYKKEKNAVFVSYNGMSYDLPVLRLCLNTKNKGRDPFEISQYIINLPRNHNEKIFEKNHVDLLAILPTPRRCSLKAMGHRMGYSVLADLPYSYDMVLSDSQWQEVKDYNKHDLNITGMLFDNMYGDYISAKTIGETYGFYPFFGGTPNIAKKVFSKSECVVDNKIREVKG